jgi:hypothetical protein
MEQEDFKQKHDLIKTELAELYLRMFKQFHTLSTLELPGDIAALSAAYGVDQEGVFIDVVEKHLEVIKLPRRKQ